MLSSASGASPADSALTQTTVSDDNLPRRLRAEARLTFQLVPRHPARRADRAGHRTSQFHMHCVCLGRSAMRRAAFEGTAATLRRQE
jgi:hypothetical protein